MNKFLDLWNYIYAQLLIAKPAIMGGTVYFIYSHVYLKRELFSNFLEFIMGVIFSMYVSPQVFKLAPSLDFSFVSFLCGLLGMTFMKVVLEINWKKYVISFIEAVFAKAQSSEKPNEDSNSDSNSNSNLK